MTKEKPYLGEILIRKNLISHQQLDDALKEQRQTGEFLGAILLRKRLITETDLLEALAEQFNIPFVSIENKEIDWKLVDLFSPSLIVDHCCFPIAADEDYITFAVVNPLDVWLLNEAERQGWPRKIKTVLVYQDEIEEFIQAYRKHLQSKSQHFFKKDKDA